MPLLTQRGGSAISLAAGDIAAGNSGGPVTRTPAEVDGKGHLGQICSTVELANGDDALTTIYFGDIRSNARISPNSKLYYDALTGVVDFDLGLGQGYENGYANYTEKSGDCLVNGLDIHLAGNASAVSAVDIANYDKTAWEIAGFASDPGGVLNVVGTLKAAATAAGTVTLHLMPSTP
jgi:hypothetical protein